MAKMPFIAFFLTTRQESRRVLIKLGADSLVIRLVLFPRNSPTKALLSRHDRKAGKQLPGASIAKQSDRAHHRGGRREVGIKPTYAGCWVLASTHSIARMLYSLQLLLLVELVAP